MKSKTSGVFFDELVRGCYTEWYLDAVANCSTRHTITFLIVLIRFTRISLKARRLLWEALLISVWRIVRQVLDNQSYL